MDFTAQSLTKARDAGYTDDEIWGFLSEQNKGFSGARDAGYSLDETMDYVSKNPSIFAPQGTSFTKEIQQMGAGFMESLGRPLESIGETAEVFGFTDIAEGLKGAITEPENYESASARFAEPKEGDASFLGFAWQYAPRAIVEQTGQLLGSMATRGAGAIAGAPLGPGGVAAGAFVGPAVFEAAQIIGPVAKERAANNGREVPNQEDIAGAILTATGSGALNAIGARYLPGGEKATGKFFKRLATSFLGEGTTETGSAFVEQIGGTAFTEKGLEVSPKQALAEGIIGGGSSATITTIAAPLHREPKEKKIVTEEEAEEQDIEGKSNIEAINLTAPAGDIQTKKDVSRIGELEKVKAENELLSQALEPNEPEAKRLDLENAAIDKEIKRLQGSVIEGAGLTPITKAEEEAVAASKEETPASISAKVEQIKVNMAGLDPTSRRYAQLQEELSTEEGKLVSQQQAELAKAIAEEPVAPEVAPTEEVAPVEPTAPTEVAPPTAQVEPVSEPITPVVSEEGVQVSDITTAPVTEQAEAPTITEPTTPEAPAPEAMQMAFDDANPNIVTNQEDLINTFTPQEKAEYTELEDLRYKSAAMQGPEKGYKPFKLTKKQKDRRVELEQKFRDREQKAGAASQVRFDVTASRPVKASLVENFNITLPEGYTKQGDLYVYQPTPAVSETITEPAAAPAGPAVGNRIRLGRSPQAYVIEEVIPQTDREKELGEQYYSVKNERTGEVETVEAKDLKPVQKRILRKGMELQKKLTVIPPKKRISEMRVKMAVRKFFGGQLPKDVVILNDDVDPDNELTAAYDLRSGELLINRAFLDPSTMDADNLYNIDYLISHELGHYLFGDEEFRSEFIKMWNNLPETKRKEIEKMVLDAYEEGTPRELAEEQIMYSFNEILFDTPKSSSAWNKFLRFVERTIKRLLGVDIKLTERGKTAMGILESAVQRFAEGEFIPRTEEELALLRGEEPRMEARPTKDAEVNKQVSEARKIEQVTSDAVSALGADVKADYDAFLNEGKTLDQIASASKRSVNAVRVNIVKSENAIKKALNKARLKPLDAKAENPVVEWTTKAAKKYMTKEGNLPGGTFQKWVKRNARLSKEAEQVRQTTEKLYSALRKIYKINKIQFILKGLSSVPAEMVEQLNEALAGNIDINTLDKSLRKPITKMREHIDAMSSELIATGQLPDYLETKALNNLGVYLTRSYKIFSDPKWIEKIPAEKLTNARNFLYQQGAKNDPSFTFEDADRQLEQMLNDWAGEAEAKDKRRGGKLGAKDLSVMMTRSEIPKALRDVMGENNNIIFNYANTISKVSRFIADQNFLDAVKQEGAGKFLYTKDAAPAGFNTLIAAEESRTMSPLNGLRTTPEIAEAFAEFGKAYDASQNPFLYALGWMNAVGKANLTVGSILTQMRNLIGQPFFFVANGHTNLKVIGNEVSRLMKENKLTKEEAREELVKMAAGEALVGENAYAGELKEAFEQVGLKTFEDMDADEFARQFVLFRLFKSGTRKAQQIYQKTDEFGKIIGWLNETDRVMRMNKGMSREEAMSIASERVRNTYPTYSQGSQALRLFRRQPFIGPFATFFYETFRTTYWNTRYAFEDINKGGQARKEGIARLAGTMIQLSVGSFIANALSKAIAGIGGEEEEDVRRMLPPWEKDASMIWFPKDKQGVYNYINLSYLSPYNAITDPFVAMMSGFARGEDPVTIFTEAAGSFLEPFVSEQPVTAAIMDVARNKTETGKKIYNEEADLSTKTTDILLHVFGKTFTPGTVDRIRKRIVPAIYGETVGTRAPEPLKEITSELTGIRFQNLDMKQAFQNRAWEFNKSQNESERIFRDVATRRRRVTAEEQIKAYRTAEQSRFENWQEMYRDYMAVRRAGATEDEAIDLMRDIKISKREAYMIADGEYMPYEVSNEVLRRSELNGNDVPLDEIEAIADSMPTTLQDLPKKP